MRAIHTGIVRNRNAAKFLSKTRLKSDKKTAQNVYWFKIIVDKEVEQLILFIFIG